MSHYNCSEFLAKLVIRHTRKVSRTDIFEVLFGPDEEVKHIAHELYSECYRCHYGEVHLFEEDARQCLLELRDLKIRIGIATCQGP
jgi:phosphoglycolate phosphatase